MRKERDNLRNRHVPSTRSVAAEPARAMLTPALLASALGACDRKASLKVIRYFHKRMLDGNPYEVALLLKFVSVAFRRITDEGYSADQAFGLRLRRGKYPRKTSPKFDVTLLSAEAIEYCEPDPDVQWDLMAVLHGSRSDVDHDGAAARRLIEYFHLAVTSGFPFDFRQLQQYVFHSFDKIIVDNFSADHAFGLKLKRGIYQRKNTWGRDVRATARIILLMRAGHDNWIEAKNEVVVQLSPDGKGERAIDAAYRRYGDHLETLPTAFLESLDREND